MPNPISRRVCGSLVLTLFVLIVGSARAQEVHVIEQTAWVNAYVAAPCPPDQPAVREDATATEDLTAFTATAQVDTTSACGAASAGSGITTSIVDSTLTIDFDTTVSLDGHRYGESGSHFLFRFELDAPADYTLELQGSFAYEDSLGWYAWHVSFGDVHFVGVDEPVLDVLQTGSLPASPSVLTLEGHCNAVRNMQYLISDWEPMDGVTTMTGSLRLTIHGARIVADEQSRWGDLRSSYR